MNFPFRRFLKSSGGNMTLTFAFSLVGMIISAGVAIDFVRSQMWETKLQTAVDAAALAAASASLSEDDSEKLVKKYMANNFVANDEIAAPTIKVEKSDNLYKVTASSKLKTSLMSIADFSKMAINVESQASSSDVSLEIALVLDGSGSMNAGFGGGNRMDALKTAAQNLVDTVTANGANMSKVKISIVPFNMAVNVGKANGNIVQGTANPWFAGQAWEGCVMERPGVNASTDNYDGSNAATGKWMAYAWPPEPDSDSYSCSNRSDGTNTGYASLGVNNGYNVQISGPNFNCIRHPLMRLSNSYPNISAEISSLTAEYNDGTIIGPAVGWGYRALSPNGPFKDGAKFSASTKKFMIVLTDGEQTTEAEYGVQGNCSTASNTSTGYNFSPATFGLPGKPVAGHGPSDTFSPYGYIKDSDPFGTNPSSWTDVGVDLFNASKVACDTVKAADAKNPIEVFTIAVSNDAGPGTLVNTLLSGCASKPTNFFLASDASGLTAAFQTIADQIANVRLTQ